MQKSFLDTTAPFRQTRFRLDVDEQSPRTLFSFPNQTVNGILVSLQSRRKLYMGESSMSPQQSPRITDTRDLAAGNRAGSSCLDLDASRPRPTDRQASPHDRDGEEQRGNSSPILPSIVTEPNYVMSVSRTAEVAS